MAVHAVLILNVLRHGLSNDRIVESVYSDSIYNYLTSQPGLTPITELDIEVMLRK